MGSDTSFREPTITIIHEGDPQSLILGAQGSPCHLKGQAVILAQWAEISTGEGQGLDAPA